MESNNQFLRMTTYNAGMIQSQAFRALSNFMTEQLVKYDLSLSEWKLLGHLRDVEDMTPSEISELLSVKLPISSRLLKSLEAKGLLRRRQNKKDSRMIHARITKQGQKLSDEVENYLKKSMRMFLGDIKQDELGVYLNVMTKIADKVS